MSEKSTRRVSLLTKALQFVEDAGGLSNAQKLLATVKQLEEVRTVEIKTQVEEEGEDA